MKIICFHNPDEENGYLSNWFLAPFSLDGTIFSSIEQYMMYKKAVCFHDEQVAKAVLETNDAATLKALGRKVAGYNDRIWNGVRQIIVYEGLLEKFKQNKLLAQQLKNTGDAILAECAVKDTIWGIGLSMEDPARLTLSQWRGKNLLGFSLMLVRDML